MPARKIPERVCVLVNRQGWVPFVGACKSRQHMHMSGEKAVEVVHNGSAHWEEETWADGKNKEHSRTLPAIRLNGKKRWKGKISGLGTGRPMKCMQLVSN